MLKLGRRIDFDWLRIIALGLLIVTHTTYVYRTFDWRVNSLHEGLWANLVVEAMAPWRISLVFFIGGAATRFMLEAHDFGGFLRNRAMRLIVPFAMALVVLVPTMTYMADPSVRAHQDYLHFLMGDALRLHTVYGLRVPDFGHVWFLPYLFLYAMMAGLAWRFARDKFMAVNARIAEAPVFLIVAGLAGFFIIANALLAPTFGRSNMLVNDPASHVAGIPPFLLGLMLARAPQFWTELRRVRPILLAVTIGMLPVVMSLAVIQAQPNAAQIHGLARFVGLGDGVYGAVALFTIVGFASTALNRRAPGLQYFGDAIMPVYLLHQPVIVAAGLTLPNAGLPVWIEYPVMLVIAGGIPLIVYHVLIRPFAPMRILFGVKAHAGGKIAPTAAGDAPHTA